MLVVEGHFLKRPGLLIAASRTAVFVKVRRGIAEPLSGTFPLRRWETRGKLRGNSGLGYGNPEQIERFLTW